MDGGCVSHRPTLKAPSLSALRTSQMFVATNLLAHLPMISPFANSIPLLVTAVAGWVPKDGPLTSSIPTILGTGLGTLISSRMVKFNSGKMTRGSRRSRMTVASSCWKLRVTHGDGLEESCGAGIRTALVSSEC
jgi:hypothetical protein